MIELGDTEKNKLILVFDDKAAFTVGKYNGQMMGVSIQIPQIAYMIKSVIKMLGES